MLQRDRQMQRSACTQLQPRSYAQSDMAYAAREGSMQQPHKTLAIRPEPNGLSQNGYGLLQQNHLTNTKTPGPSPL